MGKEKKFKTKELFGKNLEDDFLVETNATSEIKKTNKNFLDDSKLAKEDSIKDLTKEKLVFWGKFLDKKTCDINFGNLLIGEDFFNDIKEILGKKSVGEKNIFWENLDNFIDKSNNLEFIEKYLKLLKLRKNSCPSDKFIIKLRKRQEKLLYKDLKKYLKGYKYEGKDAYKVMQEKIKKDYCLFDLKEFLNQVEKENSSKISISSKKKILRDYSSLKTQIIEQKIYKEVGYTTTSLAYLNKKDFDKVVSSLDEDKKNNLKKLLKQKYLLEQVDNNLVFDENIKNFLEEETQKEEIEEIFFKKENNQFIDFLVEEDEKNFSFNLGGNLEKKVEYKIEKLGDFFEVKVGDSSILCENLFELKNVLDTGKYFSFLGLSFLVPYLDTILYYFRQKTRFKFDFKDGISIKEKHLLHKMIFFLFNIKENDKDLGISDEKIKDISNNKKNYFYKLAIKTSWFKNGDFKKEMFEKEIKKFTI